MKLNRKWLLVAALVLSMTMAISGTLAYLTDHETTVNTFTLGNVDIELVESYQQNSALNPGVAVVKKAGIENTHKDEPAYVWMIVSVPSDLDPYITLGWANGFTAPKKLITDAPYDGYTSYLVAREERLPAGESTGNMLESVTLSPMVDFQNGKYIAVNNGVATQIGDVNVRNIIVDAYAIQTVRFDSVNDAIEAYNDQWDGYTGGTSGDMNATPIQPTKTVRTQAGLQEAIYAATEDTTIILADNISGNFTVPQREDVKITIRGEGNSFKGSLLVDGRSASINSAGLVLDNLHFTATELDAGIDACIRLGDGTNNTRYTYNVTIQNCTFNVPNAVGISSYTGGGKNLKVINCTANENAHSLMQVAGEDGILIRDCEVKSARGMNFNQSNNIVIENCKIDVDKYAVRFGASSGDMTKVESYLIKNSTLNSKNVGGDPTIIFRPTASDSTLTFEGTNTITAADSKKLGWESGKPTNVTITGWADMPANWLN